MLLKVKFKVVNLATKICVKKNIIKKRELKMSL
jgi:hypothetical protein